MRGRQGKIRCENEPRVGKFPRMREICARFIFFAPSVLTISYKKKKAVYSQFAQKLEEISLCNKEDSPKKKSLPLRRRRLSEEAISTSATKKTL